MVQRVVRRWSFLSLLIAACLIQRCQSWSVTRLFRRLFFFKRQISFPDNSQDIADEYFMKLALKEAKSASKRYNEVPIGAVIVRRSADGRFHQVLSKASNRVERMKDASAHAELLALRGAARRIDNWRLLNATLYTTLEPCPLCLSASLNFRVSRIVYGAPDHRLGAIKTLPNNLIQQHPFHSIHDVRAGVLRNESAAILQDFFRRKRTEKGADKTKLS